MLITVDALRADHLGSYGYRRSTSPNLDRLARDGARFDNVMSQGAWTFSALPSLLTSRFPQDHVDLWVDEIGAARMASDAPTLAQTFKAAGYETALVSGHAGLGAILGIRRGLDSVDVGDYRAVDVTRRALGLVERDRQRPLFLWLHYMDPHAPYDPPAPFDTRFVGDGRYATRRTLPLVDARWIGRGGIPSLARLGDRRDLDLYVSRYDGEIAYTDAQIGRLLAAIGARGGRPRTIVAVTADHGESLGEHELYFSHTADLHAAIVTVPWIVAWPGTVAGGRVVRAQAMSVDIAPTLAALAGLDVHARGWVGRSFADCARGGACPPTTGAGARPAFATRGVEAAIRAPPWKLICTTPRGQPSSACRLYDLGADPGERTDVGSAHTAIAARLRRELDAWRRAHPDRVSHAESGVVIEVDPETRAALRALGYVQ